MRIRLIFGIINFILASGDELREVPCRLYLANSGTVSNHRGIFAGTGIEPEEVIIRCEDKINHRYNKIMISQLANYVFNNYEDNGKNGVLDATALLGIFMSFNHQTYTYNAEYNSPDFEFIAKKSILAGQEIFISYGEDTWFQERGIELITGNFVLIHKSI